MARKRRHGAREPNGRLQRPSSKQKAVDERAQVLAQPHRKDDGSQQCGDAFGRYCLKYNLPPAVYDAGQRYAHMVIRWRTMVGVPVDIDARVDHFTALPLSLEELETMKRTLRFQIDKLEHKIIQTVGRDALKQIQAMLFEEREVAYSEPLQIGLDTLARQLGYFRVKLHPFK